MTGKEATYESHKITVLIQISKVRDAEVKLAEGFKKAKAEFDEKIALLKSDVAREELKLKKTEVWMEESKATFEKGFES